MSSSYLPMGAVVRCTDCSDVATHRGRCATHHGAFEARPAVRSRRSRARRRAARFDAAARLRARIDVRGTGWCAWCGEDFPAADVDVDHVRPLSQGGEDVDRNVHVLCRGCHTLKTEAEAVRDAA
ncbi:HNH endonuclease signature motif containing protein [Kitasatospora sp. NPDC001527]|uniref:HNH endonuclease n=1 Tax=Kitasatospora sp. NPDC001527 TaxID=3154519 RepID=UPI00331F51CD